MFVKAQWRVALAGLAVVAAALAARPAQAQGRGRGGPPGGGMGRGGMPGGQRGQFQGGGFGPGGFGQGGQRPQPPGGFGQGGGRPGQGPMMQQGQGSRGQRGGNLSAGQGQQGRCQGSSQQGLTANQPTRSRQQATPQLSTQGLYTLQAGQAEQQLLELQAWAQRQRGLAAQPPNRQLVAGLGGQDNAILLALEQQRQALLTALLAQNQQNAVLAAALQQALAQRGLVAGQ